MHEYADHSCISYIIIHFRIFTIRFIFPYIVIVSISNILNNKFVIEFVYFLCYHKSKE
jgi:uncharacterized membrane protein